MSRFSLAASGIRPCLLADLSASLDDLEINGPSAYGYPPLQRALSHKCGVTEDRLVAAVGCSMANHVAFAAILRPDDHVLIERPFYEPLPSLARHLGADVGFFDRRPEEGYAIDPERVGVACFAHAADRRKNLHNPEWAATDARHGGAWSGRAQAGARVSSTSYLDRASIESDPRPPRQARSLWGRVRRDEQHEQRLWLERPALRWIIAEQDLGYGCGAFWNCLISIPALPEGLRILALSRLADRGQESGILQANERL